MTRRVLFAFAWAAFTVSAGWICFGGDILAYNGSGVLARRVPAWFSIESYADAVRLIRERTGLQVSCPLDLEALLKEAPVAGSFGGEPPDKQEPAREFLNHLVRCKLGLEWKLDADKGEVKLDVPWRKADPRSAPELLQTLCQQPSADSLEWHNTLDTLLSKPGNYETAWRVRQFAHYQSFFHERGDCLWAGRVILETQHPLVMVIVRHRIHTYPGRGAVSCYAFKEDGTLQWADLVDSGWRCDLTRATVMPSVVPAAPTEMRWTVTVNISATYIARFRFTDYGLRWVGSNRMNGEEAALEIGRSLMPRQPAS